MTEPRISEPELAALDAAGPELAALAERGACITCRQLTPAMRASCEQAIAAWQQCQTHYLRVQQRAIAASRTIATRDADHEGYDEAVREFRIARDELNRLCPHRARVQNSANNAQAQLAHDRSLRQRHAQDIEDSHRARTDLEKLLRSRISEAIQWRRPLPGWFADTLGGTPQSDNPARWLEVAAQLVRYRITYAVTDLGSALGTRPGPSACARRRRWFGELERELLAYQALLFVKLDPA
jgi:hypothetical protein